MNPTLLETYLEGGQLLIQHPVAHVIRFLDHTWTLNKTYKTFPLYEETQEEREILFMMIKFNIKELFVKEFFYNCGVGTNL